jgi:hypothetical protein
MATTQYYKSFAYLFYSNFVFPTQFWLTFIALQQQDPKNDTEL